MRLLCLVVFMGLFLTCPAYSASREAVENEIHGLDPSSSSRQTMGIQTRGADQALPASGLLLIPESTNDRVMAFDPMTGDLVDADFIPSDFTNLSTPINAILGPEGDSILVSDQIEDVVQEYDLDGNYIGIFAPAAGPDASILDNIRGIALRASDRHLLVTVGGGANADTVAEFDTDGVHVGNFIAAGAGGLSSPFDVYERGGDFLVGGINSDAIHRYDASGSPLADLSGLSTFPEQIAETASGTVLVGNFSGTQEGVVEIAADGSSIIGVYNPALLGGYRGVYELPNGNILTTNDAGVHEIDRSGTLVETKISGVSARFIEYVAPDNVPPIPTLNEYGLMLLALLLFLSMAMTVRRKQSWP